MRQWRKKFDFFFGFVSWTHKSIRPISEYRCGQFWLSDIVQVLVLPSIPHFCGVLSVDSCPGQDFDVRSGSWSKREARRVSTVSSMLTPTQSNFYFCLAVTDLYMMAFTYIEADVCIIRHSAGNAVMINDRERKTMQCNVETVEPRRSDTICSWHQRGRQNFDSNLCADMKHGLSKVFWLILQLLYIKFKNPHVLINHSRCPFFLTAICWWLKMTSQCPACERHMSKPRQQVSHDGRDLSPEQRWCHFPATASHKMAAPAERDKNRWI